MSDAPAVAQFMGNLMAVKGIIDVTMLPSELKKDILCLEIKEECQANNFFQKTNAGVREVLKREFMVAAITDDNYTYPPETVELLFLGDTVGEEIRDKSRLEQLKSDPNAMLLGDSFVIYKDRLPKDSIKKAMSGQIKVFIPPMSVGVMEADNVYSTVLGMPSTQTDVFLKEWLKSHGFEALDERRGVILIGFNLMR